MKRYSYFLNGLLIGLFLGASVAAAAQPQQQIEIVFDASRSMNDAVAGSQNSRLNEAKKALQTLAEQIDPGANVGVRIFGKNPVQGNVKDSCFDSKLVIPIQPYQKQAMLDEVVGLAANGQTPLGYSLELAGQDFVPDPNVKKTVILISDGEESCGKDPVNVIGALKARGINFMVHAIGFAVDPKTKAQLQQITNMTGGTYQDAQNGVQLKESLQKVAEKENIIAPSSSKTEKVPEPAEPTQEELLLRAQRGKGENLLSAVNGVKIVSATNEDVAYAIDGSDDTYAVLDPGVNAVVSFKDNQPILLESFAVPILEEDAGNPKEIILSGSLDSSQTGFFPVATATFVNKVDFKNVYQEFKIEPPVAVRYLKITTGVTFGNSSGYHREWRALGKFLTEEELKAKAAVQGGREINLIAKDAGGQIAASSGDGFDILIDGSAGANAESVAIENGNEVIFGFQGGQTAYLTKFSVPIYQAYDTNCKTFEISASQQAPDSGFTEVGTFQTTNLLMNGKPMQVYAFPQPISAKYVKVKLMDTHSESSYCYLTELQVLGTFSAPANFSPAAQSAGPGQTAPSPASASLKSADAGAEGRAEVSGKVQQPKEAAPKEVAAEKISGTGKNEGGDFYDDFKTDKSETSEPSDKETV